MTIAQLGQVNKYNQKRKDGTPILPLTKLHLIYIMKYFKICLLLLPFLFMSFGVNTKIKKPNKKDREGANDAITISMDKLKIRGGLYLRYDDIMDNELHYPYDKKADKQATQRIIAKTPMIFNDDDVLGQGARYILLAGDSVNVTEDRHDKLLKFTSGDDVRNNELNFFNALKNNLENFSYYKMTKGIHFGDPSNQVLKEIFIYYKSADYRFANKYTLTKYNDQISFLKNYAKAHTISPKMEKIFEDILYFDYATFKFMTAVNLARQNLKPDSVLINDMQLFSQKINQDNYQYISGYRSSLRNYTIYLNIYNNPKKMPVYDLINQSFTGASKDYLLFYTIRKYVSAQKIESQMLAGFYKDCINNVYITEIKHYTGLADKKMQAALSDNMGKTTTFDAITQKYKLQKDSVLYIDFWASWCVPCIEQMSNSAKLREELKNYPIRFLYFSMDNSFSSWQTSSKLLKHNNSDNFLVANSFHSPLASAFKLTTIPRYIIINKEGDIIAGKGSGGAPSEKATKDLLMKLANEQIVAVGPIKQFANKNR